MPHLTIFYDGCCHFCNFVVRMLWRLDRRHVLRFEPIQSEAGQAVINRHSELRNVDSAFLVEDHKTGGDSVWVESELFSRLVRYIPWPEKLLLMPFSIVPKGIGSAIYRFIARNRTKIFGRYESCPVPPR